MYHWLVWHENMIISEKTNWKKECGTIANETTLEPRPNSLQKKNFHWKPIFVGCGGTVEPRIEMFNE